MRQKINVREIAGRGLIRLLTSAASVATRGSSNALAASLPYIRARFALLLIAGLTVGTTVPIVAILVASDITANRAEFAPVAQVQITIAEAEPVFASRTLPRVVHDELLRVIANRHFDFAYMAELALGTRWQELSPKQQRQFIRLFENYVLATYLTTFHETTVDAAAHALPVDTTYEGSAIAAVHSSVRLPMLDVPLEVQYMLRKNGRRWKLYDIVVDDASTIANYRERFAKVIDGSGYDKLLTDLSAKNPPGVE